MEPAKQEINVFISYSHEDEKYLKELLVYLKPLEREGQVVPWSDKKIIVGSDWQKEIEQAIERADIAILLISQPFVASKFIFENELPPLLLAKEVKYTIEVIPVVIRLYYTTNPDFARYQAVNDPKKPLADMRRTKREEWWKKVAEAVEQAAKRQLASKQAKASAQTGPDPQQPAPVSTPPVEKQVPPVPLQDGLFSPQTPGKADQQTPPVPAPPPPAKEQTPPVPLQGVPPALKSPGEADQQPAPVPVTILPTKEQIPPAPLQGDLSAQQTVKASQSQRRTPGKRCFCPYCHEEIDFTLCTIVATQPLYHRGKILSTAAQRFALDQAGIEKIFEQHKEQQPRFQCHRCKYILPSDITTTPFKKIIIVGNTESGLPSYLAALIYQMNKQSTSSQLSCVTPLVIERYNQRISHAPFPSLSELIRVPNPEARDPACPLIYEFPARTSSRQRLPKTYLAIYEVTSSAFTSNFRIQQHVAQANACIYVHSSTGSAEAFLHTLFPELSSATPCARLPIAVTFTKADLLAPSSSRFPPPPAFSTSSVDLTDLRAIERMLLNTLADNASAQTLIATAQAKIDSSHVHFFTVSSLHNTSLSREPFRCLDPLFWLLYKLGLMMATQNNANNGSAI